MRRSVVIRVSSTGPLIVGGRMPRFVENARTGEVMEIVTYGVDWIEVLRETRWRRVRARLLRLVR